MVPLRVRHFGFLSPFVDMTMVPALFLGMKRNFLSSSTVQCFTVASPCLSSKWGIDFAWIICVHLMSSLASSAAWHQACGSIGLTCHDGWSCGTDPPWSPQRTCKWNPEPPSNCSAPVEPYTCNHHAPLLQPVKTAGSSADWLPC